MTLPELTDEQIDAAWEGMNAVQDSTMRGVSNRGSNRWTALRAAFPRPVPPPPDRKIGNRWHVWIASPATDPYVILDGDGNVLSCTEHARDMAGALVECADWIEANR